ncbi:MAG: hypothetical protein QF632_02100 [Candidatus Woesearchaeota archaeon]|jgi:hypothetical protein|nr:hypothetical protein [Candidatus Woesearchaeota archaeon]MDP7323533.1 hypothetical protein [Candidatus Woesearchaeota archaeon]MDP7457733.1 hypothetical protein [Candidatus Woesearchaeota archaeon]
MQNAVAEESIQSVDEPVILDINQGPDYPVVWWLALVMSACLGSAKGSSDRSTKNTFEFPNLFKHSHYSIRIATLAWAVSGVYSAGTYGSHYGGLGAVIGGVVGAISPPVGYAAGYVLGQATAVGLNTLSYCIGYAKGFRKGKKQMDEKLAFVQKAAQDLVDSGDLEAGIESLDVMIDFCKKQEPLTTAKMPKGVLVPDTNYVDMRYGSLESMLN